MRKKNLEVFKLAVEIATSGKAKDWKDVQEKLVAKGYKHADDLLDGDKIRTMLDLLCARGARATN